MINVHDPRVTEKFQARVNGTLYFSNADSYGDALQHGLELAEAAWSHQPEAVIGSMTVTVERIYLVGRNHEDRN